MDRTLTLILAGGEGRRLLPLTEHRPKPVMPFGGRCLIDYTLENCIRSGLRNVVVLTQHLADAVHEHLADRWSDRIPSLHALSAAAAGRRFRGTVDAARAALARHPDGNRVLVLAADHVYHMDYRNLMTDHRAMQADATVSVVPVPLRRARALGCVTVDKSGLVQRFVEKPSKPEAMPAHPRHALASMGIYLFRRAVLEEFLYEYPEADDFALHVLPGLLLGGRRVGTHFFAEEAGPHYWRDIGDPESYYAGHMDLLRGTLGDCDSWIGPRSLVAGGEVQRCVLGRDVQVGPNAVVRDSVLLDGAIVGRGAHIEHAIVLPGVLIAANARIGNRHTLTIVSAEQQQAGSRLPAAS